MEVNVEVDHNLFGGRGLWWARLKAGHVDLIICKNLESLVEDAWFIGDGEKNTNAVRRIPKLDGVIGVALASHDVGQIAHAHHSTEVGLLGKKQTAWSLRGAKLRAHGFHELVLERAEFLHA